MNYAETIEYLYTRLPMFTRIGAAAYKKDLHNTIALCDTLQNPQQHFKTIHVAGTNGKGSCSHMLASVLQQAGYKTGLYTSPHIKAFGERIRINGVMIEEQFVVDFVKRTNSVIDHIEPSFFELTVGMAFEYFAREKVDIAVIETGLGGRLDSTNIIQPELSVITNIGYDHMNILGNTLEAIAHQKAGIIKHNTPAVIGEYLTETKPIFLQEAALAQASLVFASEVFEITSADNDSTFLHCRVNNKLTNQPLYLQLDLNGWYQQLNLCTVLTAIEELKKIGYQLSDQVIIEALRSVKKLTGMRGRWDIIQSCDPVIIQDVAHNKDGIKQVLMQLENNYPSATYHFILGFVSDKDVTNVLDLFPKDAQYYFTNAHIPRALPNVDLMKLAANKGLHGEGYDDVNQAIFSAKAAAAANDVIMICGSFFIIAEIK
ncbi:MAG: folylpolyglutamate synthase/dihydrofolate synthase family protein [Ferruginibacter sp.]